MHVAQTGDRIVVGVSKTGGGSGNPVAAGETTIVSFLLEVLKEGTTSISFDGSPSNPIYPTAQPAVLDSSGSVIDSMTFDPFDATVTGVIHGDVNCPRKLLRRSGAFRREIRRGTVHSRAAHENGRSVYTARSDAIRGAVAGARLPGQSPAAAR
jgi:hypothetical protein